MFCTKHHSNVIIVLVNQNIRSVRRTSIIYLKMTFPAPSPHPHPHPQKRKSTEENENRTVKTSSGFFFFNFSHCMLYNYLNPKVNCKIPSSNRYKLIYCLCYNGAAKNISVKQNNKYIPTAPAPTRTYIL